MLLLLILGNVFIIECFVNKYGLYDKNTSFPPDNAFRGLNYKLEELRDLEIYEEAWTKMPENFFDVIPDSFNNFYKVMNVVNLRVVMNSLAASVDRNRKKEIFTILIRYSYCLKKKDVYRNCPSPCKNKPCIHLNHTNVKAKINKYENCKEIFDPKIKLDQSLDKFKGISTIFKYRFECFCPLGYKWEMIDGNGNCIEVSDECNNLKKCNHGTCYPRDIVSGFICKCFAAFRGATCDVYHNPCETEENRCGLFKCTRDPKNVLHGYRCECGTAYEPLSDDTPFCIDRNECLDPTRCLNDGNCTNLDGDYSCACKTDYNGKDCEHDLTQINSIREWQVWSEWSGCSKTCGQNGAIQIRNRKCEFENSCGKTNDKNVRDCEPKLKDCKKDGEKHEIEHENKAVMYPRNTTTVENVIWIGVPKAKYGENVDGYENVFTRKKLSGKNCATLFRFKRTIFQEVIFHIFFLPSLKLLW